MKKIVVIGGGWSGCAAAATARKAGANVILIERTDMLLGTGLVGGIFRNNGRYTAAEEMINLGDDLFKLLDSNVVHKGVEFPGHHHASLYNTRLMEFIVKEYLCHLGVKILMSHRVIDIVKEGRKVTGIIADKMDEVIKGDVFVDTTGSSAVPRNCMKYGNGCAMCIQRCHSFGARVNLLSRAGIECWDAGRANGFTGAMSGSVELAKDSVSPDIVAELEEKGCVLVPVPTKVKEDTAILGTKACQQYAMEDYIDNLVILHTGQLKLMVPFFPLADLREIPGMERARYIEPIAGGKGNSMRYFGMASCAPTMQALGEVDNFFCAGEKAGTMVGHTEAIVTGSLAGHNAVRYAIGEKLLELPASLAVGDFIESAIEKTGKTRGGIYKYTFSGSVYFERMKEKNLYTLDVKGITERVKKTGLLGIFAKGLVE